MTAHATAAGAGITPTSSKQLGELLMNNGIDWVRWQYPSANTLEDLYAEIVAGECRLLPNPLRRELTVVRIGVHQGPRVLVESEMVETPGRVQTRNRRPSEKTLPGETPEVAARRGLREELGCMDEDIVVLGVDGPARETPRSTMSYPGLRSDYVIYDVQCIVTGLPAGSFKTEETNLKSGKRISHRWMWQPSDASR